MSACASTRRPAACSGAMYASVPTTSPVRVSGSSPARCATPKSSSLAGAPAVSSGTITFCGLTSRWITPRAWAWASASASDTPMRSTSRSLSSPSRSSTASVRPRTSSDTRKRSLPSTPASKTATMLGWSSRAAASASRCARSGTGPAAGTALTATARSSRSSRAAKTVPNPPEPSRAPSRYRPSTRPPPTAVGSSSVASIRRPFDGDDPDPAGDAAGPVAISGAPPKGRPRASRWASRTRRRTFSLVLL